MSEPLSVSDARRLMGTDANYCAALAAMACGWERRIGQRSGKAYWEHRNGGRKYGPGAPWPLWHPQGMYMIIEALADATEGHVGAAAYKAALLQIADHMEPWLRVPGHAGFLALAAAGLLRHEPIDVAVPFPQTREEGADIE